jgi:predicted enzyme related to lactoylglutathione lyase
MSQNNRITYIELPADDLEKTKQFYTGVFGWDFVDYGPEYCCFQEAGLDGGFFKSELHSTTATGGALVIMYSNDIEQTLSDVIQNGGSILKEIFTFPGGRRFHFGDPNGNELAVWTDQ